MHLLFDFFIYLFVSGLRIKITEELHGFTYLMEVLDNILRDTIEDASKNNSSNLQVYYSISRVINRCIVL